MDDTLWTLARVEHDAGTCLTSQIGSVYNRFLSLVALVELRGGNAALIKEINKASQDAQRLSKQRNRVVHDPIGYHENRKTVVVQRGDIEKRRLDMDLAPLNFDEYAEVRRSISEFEWRFIALRNRIYTELPAFADRLAEPQQPKRPRRRSPLRG